MPPSLTRAQARAVDSLAQQVYGYPSLLLMENAGINATAAALDLLDNELDLAPAAARVGVLCGGGNNGGDGYVIARQLHTWGAEVVIFTPQDPARLDGDAATNHAICAKLGLPIRVLGDADAIRAAAEALAGCHLLIDALLGTGFAGQVREPMATLIRTVNGLDGPAVLAVDLPSGLDCDTGQASGAAIRADLTVTFVAAKAGFAAPGAEAWTGRVVVAGIGTPPQVLERALAET